MVLYRLNLCYRTKLRFIEVIMIYNSSKASVTPISLVLPPWVNKFSKIYQKFNSEFSKKCRKFVKILPRNCRDFPKFHREFTANLGTSYSLIGPERINAGFLKYATFLAPYSNPKWITSPPARSKIIFKMCAFWNIYSEIFCLIN